MVEEGWTWEEVRGWMEGEGSIIGRVRRKKIKMKKVYYSVDKHIRVEITQKIKEPLESMCEWIKKQGISCTVYHRKRQNNYVLLLEHRKRKPLPVLRGLKHPWKKEQLERAKKLTGLEV